MKYNIYILLLMTLCVSLVFTSLGFAQQDIIVGETGAQGVNVKKLGQSTMKFLNVSVAAEAAGMGDAYLNMSNGPAIVCFLGFLVFTLAFLNKNRTVNAVYIF